MKKKHLISFAHFVLCLLMCLAVTSQGHAQEALRFSSSAQLYDILQQKTFDDFTTQTGVDVDLFISSSEAAMHRLYNQVCDVAGTAEHIYFSLSDYGYTETPLCKAPLVVITHRDTSIKDITEAQLRDVFSGNITNWKALGGPDQAIVVVVPGKDTAALKNFSQLALKRFDLRYDIMTYRSTMVVEVVRNIPGSISFITKGANARDASIRILKVNGYAHTEAAYPYFQNFSLVTKGVPGGAVKSFIEFLTSSKTKAALSASGISPQTP